MPLRKSWRWVGAFGPDVMLCVARAQVGVAAPLVVGGLGRRAAARGHARRTFRPRAHGARRRRADRAGARARAPIEVTTGAGVDAQDAAAGDRHGARRRAPIAIDAAGLLDESARPARAPHAWLWSAGAGVAASGAAVVWNLVEGMHDGDPSERTVWVDGEPHAVGRAAVRRAGRRRRPALHALRPCAPSARTTSSSPPTTSSPSARSAGSLPVAGALHGLGRDGAPRGALVIARRRSRWSRRSRAAIVRHDRAPEALVALGGAARAARASARCRGTTRSTRRRRSAPTLVVLASLLVLGDGCERAGRVRRARGAAGGAVRAGPGRGC